MEASTISKIWQERESSLDTWKNANNYQSVKTASLVNKQKDHNNQGPINENDNTPGAGVSGDQMEAGAPGLIPTTRGQQTKNRHKVVTIWIDHFSIFVYTH